MPPEARWLSISKMPLSLVPGPSGAPEILVSVSGMGLLRRGAARAGCQHCRRSGRRRADPHGYHGDIVSRATIEGEGDKQLAGALRRVVARHGEDLQILDVAGEAVTANHEHVAKFQDAA